MSGALVIQQATLPADIDLIMAVEQTSFMNPWTREMYLAECENPDVSFFFLARRESQVVGFCAFWRILDELHINNLAVVPEVRRQGVGSTLLNRILAEGRRAGAVRATLEVRKSNVAALALYQGLGFSVAATRPSYYSHPEEDAFVLWRTSEEAPSSP